MKKIAFISSPLAPYKNYTLQNNIDFAKEYCRQFLKEGYNIVCPHTFYTQFLDDTIPEERQIGFECGLQFLDICDKIFVVIRDNYISEGMKIEIERAELIGIEIIEVNVFTSNFKMGNE